MLKDVRILTVEDYPQLGDGSVSEELDRQCRKILTEGIERLQEGVYELNHFNPGIHTWDIEVWSDNDFFGVADDVPQIIKHHQLDTGTAEWVLFVTTIIKNEEPSQQGWRWSMRGPYIGIRQPRAEYLKDEPEIDKVLVYHVYPYRVDAGKPDDR